MLLDLIERLASHAVLECIPMHTIYIIHNLLVLKTCCGVFDKGVLVYTPKLSLCIVLVRIIPPPSEASYYGGSLLRTTCA